MQVSTSERNEKINIPTKNQAENDISASTLKKLQVKYKKKTTFTIERLCFSYQSPQGRQIILFERITLYNSINSQKEKQLKGTTGIGKIKISYAILFLFIDFKVVCFT